MIIIEHKGTRWTNKLADYFSDQLAYFGASTKEAINPEEDYVELILEDDNSQQSIGKFTEPPSKESLEFYLLMAGVL